jgi:hypothetical protein
MGILSGVAVFLLIERPVTRWLTRLAQTSVASPRKSPDIPSLFHFNGGTGFLSFIFLMQRMHQTALNGQQNLPTYGSFPCSGDWAWSAWR